MRKFLVLMLLFLSEVYADTQRTPQTRWQAVRFARFEDSMQFRIDVLELTDNNPPRSDVEGLGFPKKDQISAQMLQNFTKRGTESSEKDQSRRSQQLDGNLFVSEKSEGTVKLWGRNLSWHRYTFLSTDGFFDMKFVATNAEISVSGTVNGRSSGLSKLGRIAFHKEYKAASDKWKSWGFDSQDDIGESADYMIGGCYSVR